jgi:hypothetical protein
MMQPARAGALALTALTLAGFFACSSDDGSGTPVGGDATAGSVASAGQNAVSGGNAGGSSAGTTGSGGVSNASGGAPLVGIAGTFGTSGSGPSCAGDITTAKLVPLDIYLMLDSSGSMLNTTSLLAPDKWTEVGDALVAFVGDDRSAGIGLGLQYFPLRMPGVPDICNADAQCGEGGPCTSKICYNVAAETGLFLDCEDETDCLYDTLLVPECLSLGDCSVDPDAYCFTEYPEETCDGGACTPTGFCTRTASCDAAAYAAAEVPIAELPGAAAALVSSLQAKEPDGKTPTAPALSGAIEHVKAWKAAHPDHTVVALLATDGLPTECFVDPLGTSEEGIAEVTAIAADGLAAGVQTFVIGVFTAAEEVQLGARANLNAVAMAGGTEQAFLVDASQDVAMQFLDALNEIRGARLSCEFQLPVADATREVDLSKVNVDFTNGTTTTRVPHVVSQSACDASRGGWYYDVAPSAGEPSRIIICPTSCQAFQAAQNGSVQIELGCATEVIE